MKIKVKAKKAWTVAERIRMKSAAKWLSKELGVSGVRIYLAGDLDDCYGYATPDNVIFMSTCENEDPVEYLAHEMVHIQQFQTGKLKYDGETVIWKAKINKTEDYWEQPWEKEAFRRQVKLYRKMLKEKVI